MEPITTEYPIEKSPLLLLNALSHRLASIEMHERDRLEGLER